MSSALRHVVLSTVERGPSVGAQHIVDSVSQFRFTSCALHTNTKRVYRTHVLSKNCKIPPRILPSITFSHTQNLKDISATRFLLHAVKMLQFLLRHRLVLHTLERFFVSRDSTVGVATRYGLGGMGIESRWRRVFRTRPERHWDQPSLLHEGFWVPFPGVKRLGRG